MELPTADLKLDAQVARHAPLSEAIFEYERAAELCDIGLDEYQRHLANFQTNITTYISHMDEIRGHAELIRADHDFLIAIADPANRAEMIKSSTEHYLTARQRTEIIILTYYTTDEIMQKLYPQGVNKANIARLNVPPEQIHQLTQKVIASVPTRAEEYQFGDEFTENLRYLQRIETRLNTLGQK